MLFTRQSWRLSCTSFSSMLGLMYWKNKYYQRKGKEKDTNKCQWLSMDPKWCCLFSNLNVYYLKKNNTLYHLDIICSSTTFKVINETLSNVLCSLGRRLLDCLANKVGSRAVIMQGQSERLVRGLFLETVSREATFFLGSPFFFFQSKI